MICVTIGRGRHQQMIDEHKLLVELGAELVELRLDYIVRTVNLKRLIEERPGPVVVTCRRQKDGGKWNGEEEVRLTLLRSAIAAEVDYVDLEDDIAAKIPRYGKTKRIISLHDFEKTPQDIDTIHARLCELDPDIVKLATLANNPHDNLRMMQLVAKSKIPTIGICMGEMGTPTRILGAKYGSPLTFCTYNRDRVMAPGQLSFQQMRDEYNYDSVGPDTEVFGVIADPVGHSLSPLIHNAAFKHEGMNRVYLPFRVPSEHLDQFIADCPARHVKGLSVTIPHKEAVLKHCQQVNGAVQGIGATNTLVFKNGDEVYGFNTDYKAAMNCLDVRLGTTERKTPLAGHVALVLGAGGAARAIAFGLIRRGADVVVTSRTHGRALVLADELKCRATEWVNRHNVKHEVLVNATPVGMHPNMDDTPYDKLSLRPNSLVFDTVYNPEQTLLIKDARSKKCRVITGMEMFVGQAALQFEHFTGKHAPVDVMRDRIKRAIGAARILPMTQQPPAAVPKAEEKKGSIISLIGYRGTGKTTIAKLLAERLKCEWSDADVVLEAQAKQSIAEIFASQGELHFRDLESKVLTQIVAAEKRNIFVLATGGGVILRDKNCQLLREAGSVIWLTASPDVIHQRISEDETTANRRPALTDSGGMDEIEQVLAAREAMYRASAEHQIDTNEKTPDQVANEIRTWLAAQ